VVLSAIDLIAIYDERLAEAAGVEPAVDFLTPLIADWEALQAVGRRIGLLGINDYVASENLTGGARWLLTSWSGEATQAFGAGVGSLGQSLSGRSLDFEAVSKIVENGGTYLERLVYNQAAELCGGVLQPMTFLGATFPLGGWAPFVNRPIRDTIKSQISAAVDALLAAARTRQEAIRAMVDRLSRALDYVPGRPVPSFTAGDFEVPEKAVIDLGSRRYGYGDNIWWEDRVDYVM